jgi:hypothetical protein
MVGTSLAGLERIENLAPLVETENLPTTGLQHRASPQPEIVIRFL